MPDTRPLDELTSNERLEAVATILARGLLRLRIHCERHGAESGRESAILGLDVRAEMRLSVYGG
jgi:hypothetical protein